MGINFDLAFNYGLILITFEEGTIGMQILLKKTFKNFN